MVGLIILALAIIGTISWLWVGGIDYMKKNHPNYKGHDWLDWTEEEKKDII
jgi:hypothetical protein